MKLSRFLPCLAILAMAALRLSAQTPDATTDLPDSDATPPPGATVINSDELRMDQVGKTAIFTGNVVVIGNNFNMKCEEMTVFFTNDSKIDNIVAKGNVVIVQPGRITHCGQAQYFHDEDKFVLTDQPDILDNQNEIQAPKITIYRTKQTLVTEGRTTTKIIDKGGNSPLSGSSTSGIKSP
jgi:lipopolysaccharide export system protein LptA